MNTLTGYIGTYASPESLGIYRFTMDLDNGNLSKPELYYGALDCKYLSLHGTLLAAPRKRDGQAGICLLDTAGGGASLAGEAFYETAPACYVTQDDACIYTANYHEGCILVYRKSSDSLTLAKRIDIAPKAGCHQILFHNHYMLVPCLLLDTVKIYDCSRDFAPAGELRFEEGTGPRHGIFDKDHKRLFLVSELSNQLFVYSLAADTPSGPAITLEHVYPLLPGDAKYKEPPASAAIRLSPDGRFLYVSTRFADIISVFYIDGCQLKLVQQTGSGGVHPRDFTLTPDGQYLLAVNRTEGGLVSFRINPETGCLDGPCSQVPAAEAVAVIL
ncbi:lactonase family protein [Enterocloster sp. OA13]|uniref:beta-propeller fold lactonase family protein n=1 Tax=Enterocloster sp. OA13 TaxID=2914161 RepID=UPI000471D703|nr:lactonase family protein [Enterocloster sp. OA13]